MRKDVQAGGRHSGRERLRDMGGGGDPSGSRRGQQRSRQSNRNSRSWQWAMDVGCPMRGQPVEGESHGEMSNGDILCAVSGALWLSRLDGQS